MRIVVGYTDGPTDALTFAAALARSAAGSTLVVASVHPEPWPVGTAGAVDAEWQAFLVADAERSVDAAAERLDLLAPGVVVERHRHGNASSGRGLAEVAAETDADLVVIGSAPGAEPGRHGVGSTASRLLHGAATTPVVLVPSGWAGDGVTSVTVAYQHTGDCAATVRTGAALAAELGTPLHLLSLVERPPVRFPGRDRSLAAAHATATGSLAAAAAVVPAGVEVRREIGEGDDLAGALDTVAWEPGDLLVCGSGSGGVLRRVFLGDSASRLLRAARVPVAVVPRATET